MDAMALLCNVHADGPATRSLLSRAGRDTLEDLLATSREELAGILGCTPSFARRMLLEAKELAEREASLLERDEDETTPAASRPAAPRETETAQRLRPGLLAGLDATWCERLASRGVTTLEALTRASGLQLSREAGLSYARFAELQCLARGLLSTTPRPATPREPRVAAAPGRGEPLRPGLFEGLDEARCRRLAACGVTTLEALVDTSGLELARRLGLSYPRLLDLQHLARRRLAPSAPGARPAATIPAARPASPQVLFPHTRNEPRERETTTGVTSTFREETAGLWNVHSTPSEAREAQARPDPGPSGPFC